MCNRDIFGILGTDLFCELVLLKFDTDRYRTFFGLDLFALGLIRIESDIVKQCVVSRSKNITVFNIFILVQSFKILLCLFLCERSNAEEGIIGNGVCLLECCRNLDLSIFIFVYTLNIKIINRECCFTVFNALNVCYCLDLKFFIIRDDVSCKGFLIEVFDNERLKSVIKTLDTLCSVFAVNLCFCLGIDNKLEACLVGKLFGLEAKLNALKSLTGNSGNFRAVFESDGLLVKNLLNRLVLYYDLGITVFIISIGKDYFVF